MRHLVFRVNEQFGRDVDKCSLRDTTLALLK
jgi:hypothetical protein